MNWFFRMAAASQERIDFLARKYDRIVDRKTIETLSFFVDPSTNGQFTEWLVRLHAQGPGNPGYLPITDAARSWAKYVLEDFMKFKNSPTFKSPKDINQYKSLDALENACREVAELSKQELGRRRARDGQQLVYQDQNYKVLAITTAEAATEYCKDTAICLKDPHHFKEYRITPDKPIYMILKRVAQESGYGVNHMEPYAVFNPPTGEFNCMDNESVFVHGLGEEMVALIKNIPNGQRMLQRYLNELIARCESPTHYKKLADTLDKAINLVGATPSQWEQYENIIGAYPPGYKDWVQQRDQAHIEWQDAQWNQNPHVQQVDIPRPNPQGNDPNVPNVW